MPSRQDELHSYQFSTQRVVAALVTHDPDPQRSPMRRAGTTALIGVLVAALVLGGTAAYGLFTGHTMTEATDPDAVLLEKGTGARYVYLPADGRLHPILNYTSGLLLAGGARPVLKTVRPEKLAEVPLGEPLGIPGAPDTLPAAEDLLAGGWSVCTERGRSTLLVGFTPPGDPAPAELGLLVRDEAGRTHLVHQNRRFLLAADRVDAVQRALGWYGRRPWPVAAAWADAIPAGPDLAAPVISDAGRPSVISGRRAGQVLTDGSQFAVVLRDGIAPVTETQARLLAPPADIGAEFRELRASATQISGGAGLPARVPRLVDEPARACVTLVGAGGEAGVRLNASFPPGAVPAGPTRVDRVHVARGRGAVVVAAASPDAPASSGTVHLVTDTGHRYPLAGRDLLARLGYPDSSPRQVPAQLVAYLPAGPALDPVRAGRP
ncbi:type VII secretion protein EccB [Actinoplanes aureus]|uniref:Type VII secretion protein EccB n=1 Tax=Actinoplanes aureus TaxID=2792083 RepID=A0A931FZR7_9ACTN|nr:type VII secretion protein EccB [Actinoplanes aureus]MBG0560684.1 type VII secretion protein EccB [Actinoplanes aureus]